MNLAQKCKELAESKDIKLPDEVEHSLISHCSHMASLGNYVFNYKVKKDWVKHQHLMVRWLRQEGFSVVSLHSDYQGSFIEIEI